MPGGLPPPCPPQRHATLRARAQAYHILLLHRTAPSRAASCAPYRFQTRTAVVICERVLRIAGSYITGLHYEQDTRKMLLLAAAVSGGRAARFAALVEISKQLLLGTGFTIVYWHAFCLPTTWALEGVLLLPLILMSLWIRAVPTAQYLARFPEGTAMHSAKLSLAWACSKACRVALPVKDASSRVCELERSDGGVPGMEQHLVATAIIFVQYLVPLFARYLQELAAKRAFLWPHLGSRQRSAFLMHHCRRGSWSYAALAAALAAVAAAYGLAVSLVLGRLSVRYIMRAGLVQV